MQVTLWQQFSSNHSANFFLVGEFETVAEAESAAAELRQMLYEIGAWWDQFMVEDRKYIAALFKDAALPIPPEQRYQAKYQIARWSFNGHPLDWTYTFSAEQVVTHYDRLVIMNQWDKSRGTRHSIQPWKDVLERLAARPLLSMEGDGIVTAVNITAEAPNIMVLQKIQTQIAFYENYDVLWVQLAALNPIRGSLEIEDLTIYLKQLRLATSMENVRKNNISHPISLWFEEQLDFILRFLRACGCTDVRYEVVEVKD